MKSILAIGPRVKFGDGKVTGPSMMFDLLIKSLEDSRWESTIVDIVEGGSSQVERKVGEFSRARIIFYMKLLPSIWWVLITKKKLVYLIIAPTLAAFFRDACIIWVARIFRRKIICHLFGDYNDFFTKQHYLTKAIIKATLSQADKIIVEGDLVKKYLSFVKEYKDRIVSIPNGLPEKEISFNAIPKALDDVVPIYLLYMSNMIETKGYWDVLKAVDILINERGRNIKCNFAGKFIVTIDAERYHEPEQAKKEFKKYIKEKKLGGFVTYSESIYGLVKKEIFERAHLFLLPSNYVYEMQPVSILEAMAYGAVVIGTDHKLIPEMVLDDETGYVVPYNSPQVIADKIEYLIDNPDVYKKFSGNAIELYKSRFSAEIYCESVMNVFCEVTD